MGSNKRYLIVIILAVIAITIAAIDSVKGAVATEPVRPWYLEPPEVFQPTHIREGDRLYASYFNEQFNVIYNWAQRLNRDWKNFTNGTGIASITANLITAKDKIVAPVISIIKGNQPALDGNGGLIYYDKDLDRFRAYQEGAWRDLSSNVYIASDTIGSPLSIQGYLQASNIYASNTVYAHGVNNTGTLTNTGNVTIVGNTVASGTLTVNKALTTKAGINNTGNIVTEGLNATKRLKVPTFSSTQTADSSLGKGSLYFDTTNNKLKAYNGSTWVDVASGTGEWTTSSTTGNKTIDGNLTVNKALTTKAGINNTGTLTNTGNVTIVGNTVASGTLTVNKALTTKAGINNTGDVVTEGLNATKRLKVPTFSSTQTADSSLGKGSLYFDTTNNKLKAYNGSTWVDVASGTGEWTTSSTTGNKTIDGNLNLTGDLQKGSNVVIKENGMVLANRGLQIPTAPQTSTPMIGQFYFNQGEKKLKIYDTDGWIDAAGSSAGSSIAAVPTTMPANPMNGTIYWDGSKIKIYANGTWHTAATYDPILDSTNYYTYDYVTTVYRNNDTFDRVAHNWSNPMHIQDIADSSGMIDVNLPYIKNNTDNISYNSGQCVVIGEKNFANGMIGRIRARLLIPLLSLSSHPKRNTEFWYWVRLDNFLSYLKDKYDIVVFTDYNLIDKGFFLHNETYYYGNKNYSINSNNSTFVSTAIPVFELDSFWDGINFYADYSSEPWMYHRPQTPMTGNSMFGAYVHDDNTLFFANSPTSPSSESSQLDYCCLWLEIDISYRKY